MCVDPTLLETQHQFVGVGEFSSVFTVFAPTHQGGKGCCHSFLQGGTSLQPVFIICPYHHQLLLPLPVESYVSRKMRIIFFAIKCTTWPNVFQFIKTWEKQEESLCWWSVKLRHDLVRSVSLPIPFTWLVWQSCLCLGVPKRFWLGKFFLLLQIVMVWPSCYSKTADFLDSSSLLSYLSGGRCVAVCLWLLFSSYIEGTATSSGVLLHTLLQGLLLFLQALYDRLQLRDLLQPFLGMYKMTVILFLISVAAKLTFSFFSPISLSPIGDREFCWKGWWR